MFGGIFSLCLRRCLFCVFAAAHLRIIVCVVVVSCGSEFKGYRWGRRVIILLWMTFAHDKTKENNLCLTIPCMPDPP